MTVPKRSQITPKRQTEFNEEELEFEEKRISYTNTPSRCSKATPMDIVPKPTIATTPSPPSKRFEDGDPYPPLSRNSVLLHLMACGGSMGIKGKAAYQNHQSPPNTAARKSSSLHKDVLCKAAVAVGVDDEICCMSENPRFGNLQAEEREYFSGSIVETMTDDRVQVEPMLSKSSSYKEERVSKGRVSMVEDDHEEEVKREKAVAGKCIPKRFC